MIQFLKFILVFGVLFVGASSNVSAQNVQDFYISDFTQTYNLSKDSNNIAQANVTDYITAQFPDFDQNRGILRALPQRYGDNNVKLKVLAVDKQNTRGTGNNQPWDYTAYSENDNTVVKIGNPDVYVKGEQHYRINYTMSNVIITNDSGDELYININGTQWQQEILQVNSIVRLTPDISGLVTDKVCYTGYNQSNSQDCTIDTVNNSDGSKEYVFATTKPLLAEQTLTIGLQFPKDTFVVQGPSFWDKYGFILLLTIPFIIPIVVFLWLFNKWLKTGRDPASRSVVAQYQPPKDIDVMQANMILKQSHSPSSVTAQIIDLAVRGYLQIIDNNPEKDGKPKGNDYSITKLKDGSDLPKHENDVMNMLFIGSENTVKTKDLANKLSSQNSTLGKQLNNLMLQEGYYSQAPITQRNRYLTIGIILIIVGLGLTFIGIGLGIVLTGIIVAAFANIMPARTQKGVDMRNYLEGLKLYIKMAEQDRIKFHQSLDTAQRTSLDYESNAQKIHIYEQLLPYAILFGQEKSWSNQFAELYEQPPEWYRSNSGIYSGMFIAQGLSNFNTASNMTFSAPGGGSGSGFSGGGGSAGGGGGGGGGGGW